MDVKNKNKDEKKHCIKHQIYIKISQVFTYALEQTYVGHRNWKRYKATRLHLTQSSITASPDANLFKHYAVVSFVRGGFCK